MKEASGYVRTYFRCLLLGLLLLVTAETDWEVAMVADTIHGSQRPSAVIAALCCLPIKKLKLHSALAHEDKGIMVQFIEPGKIIEVEMGPSHHIVILADLGCRNVAHHLQKSMMKKHFQSPYRWILVGDTDNGTSLDPRIPEAIIDVDILPDGEVMVARNYANQFMLYYIYRIGIGSQWKTEVYGTWDASKGLKKKKLEEVTALRRRNLQGLKIPASLVITNNDTLEHLLDGKDDHIDTVSKVNYPTIEHLIDYLNATKQFIFIDSWGFKRNGSWTGMCGLLVENKVEIGGSPLFFTSDRREAMTFIGSPTLDTAVKFVFIQPKLSYTQNLYLLSFSPAVWRCLFILVLIMFLVLFAVTRWEWRKNRYGSGGERELKHRTLRGNLTDVALVVFGAICQQGSPVELKGSLGRVVTLLLFLFLMFIYTSYSANIVALLQSSSSQINTLEDLLYSRMKLGIDDTAYNKYFFSAATKPIQKALYQTKIVPLGAKPRFFPMDEGVKRIRKGEFAFHMELGVGYKYINKYFTEGEKCGLKEIEFFNMLKPWYPVRKNTQYLEIYKIGFSRIKEAGLQARENIRLYSRRPVCSGRESHFISVSMVDCYPALLELLYGIIFALFVLSIEILLKKRERIMNRICCKRIENLQ